MQALSIVKGPDRSDLLREETLASVFRTSVSGSGEKTALILGERSISYTSLDKWSDDISRMLRENGIGRGDRVGLWWPRSIELHAAILGIIKSGAAYVPLDYEMPGERVISVLSEVGASACFSPEGKNLGCKVLSVPGENEVQAGPDLKEGPEPDDIAYILYTSGSTGTPKGIPITHRQICHLLRAEQHYFEIRTEDIVYQGFSVSFDMWCEETLIAYLAGATLYVADARTARALDELGTLLKEKKITVLHAVPSLLAVIGNDIPSLRLINAGGEACTMKVLDKWATGGRKFFNTYGPTETTVSAALAKLEAGNPITLGHPLPNYGLAVVDDELRPLPRGEQGELIISGPGVSRGYINRPELNRDKFLAKPGTMADLPGERIYRTGDAAVMGTDGTISFCGRLDDQVKLRGYRIELGEIESHLTRNEYVVDAAVALQKDNYGEDQLIAYVVMKVNAVFNEGSLRSALAGSLPPYMVPLAILQLDELPRHTSGKINRRVLPQPESLNHAGEQETEIPIDPALPVKEKVVRMLGRVFPNRSISPDMDFFHDLGGHSLLAASFVSMLRNEAGLTQASIKDVYVNRPLTALIGFWEASEAKEEPKKGQSFNPVPHLRYLACWIAQSFALLLIYGLFALEIFLPWFGYYYVQQETKYNAYALLCAIILFLFIPVFFNFLSIGVKWLVIGKMREGDYPLWGFYYFRWWFVTNIQKLVPVQFLAGTPLYLSYLRMTGVKVSKDAQLSLITIGAPDLVSIGSDVSISSAAVIDNAYVEDGLLKIRSVSIADHAYIGSSAVIAGDVKIGAWGELKDLSFITKGNTIRQGEIWQGSPAVCIGEKKPEELPQPVFVEPLTRKVYSVYFTIAFLIFALTTMLPLLPTIMVIIRLDEISPDYNFAYLALVPLLTLSYILLFMAETILLSRWLQYGIRPGTYPVYSFFYWRKWMSDQLISLSLIVLHPIYATVFAAPFYRALGARVGKGTEISTASSVTHPLLELGDGAFIADAVTLGEADVRAQQLILKRTVIGNNSFVGNSALIHQGYQLPDNMLIGVLSTPPGEAQLETTDTKDWFGSPAIALPNRQLSRSFPEAVTTKPSRLRKLARGLVELVRILLPETVVITCSILLIAYGDDLIREKPAWQVILEAPFYYLAFLGLPAFLLTVVFKWLIVGRYKPGQYPMWTWHVWRFEAVTTTYEALAIPFFLEFLQGTAWLPLLLRILGVKTGRRVWLNTCDITEFDMVSIGDDSALNDDCGPQTHLFEDRVMKIGRVNIGKRCSVGARSIILYDCELEDDVHIEPLSLVMKGEKLGAGTRWEGSPVKPAS